MLVIISTITSLPTSSFAAPCHGARGIYVFLRLFIKVVLDLQKSCKNGTELSYVLHPASSNINILHNHGTFAKTKE